MTGEVTDRFNGITLFRIALFWKKQLNILQTYNLFSHRKSGMLILHGILQLTGFTDLFQTGVECGLLGRRVEDC